MFQFLTYIFSADIIPEMLKLCRVTKNDGVLSSAEYVFNFNLFEFSAPILEKGPLKRKYINLEDSNYSVMIWRRYHSPEKHFRDNHNNNKWEQKFSIEFHFKICTKTEGISLFFNNKN